MNQDQEESLKQINDSLDRLNAQPLQPEVSYSYQDSICNILSLGDVKLQSPRTTMKELFKLAKEILKDKDTRDYLEKLKQIKNSKPGGYFG